MGFPGLVPREGGSPKGPFDLRPGREGRGARRPRGPRRSRASGSRNRVRSVQVRPALPCRYSPSRKEAAGAHEAGPLRRVGQDGVVPLEEGQLRLPDRRRGVTFSEEAPVKLDEERSTGRVVYVPEAGGDPPPPRPQQKSPHPPN